MQCMCISLLVSAKPIYVHQCYYSCQPLEPPNGSPLDAIISQALTVGITVPIITAAASTGLQSPWQLLPMPMLLLFRY